MGAYERYTLPVIRYVGPGDVMYSMLTTVNKFTVHLQVAKRESSQKLSQEKNVQQCEVLDVD